MALTSGHRAQRACSLLTEADQPQAVRRSGARFAAGQAAHLGQMADEIDGAHLVGQNVTLWSEPDLGPQRRPLAEGIQPQHRRRTRRWRAQAKQRMEQRRLARAIRADKPGHAGSHLDIQRCERHRRPESLRQRRCLDDHRYVIGDAAHLLKISVVLWTDRSCRGPLEPQALTGLVSRLGEASDSERLSLRAVRGRSACG